jgi:hypothetical protein
MTIEEWVLVCMCVEEGEKIYIRYEHVVDNILMNFFITIRSSDLDEDKCGIVPLSLDSKGIMYQV